MKPAKHFRLRAVRLCSDRIEQRRSLYPGGYLFRNGNLLTQPGGPYRVSQGEADYFSAQPAAFFVMVDRSVPQHLEVYGWANIVFEKLPI